MRTALMALMVLTTGLAGCLGGDTVEPQLSDEPTGALAWTPCEHPWPCADGSEWPVDLTGPFELLEIVPHRVQSFDGTELAGHVWLPDVPDGTPVPVVLWSSPYFGQPPPPFVGQPSQPTDSPDLWNRESVPVGMLVEQGYAVAAFNVRGTGESGGCFEDKGSKSQRDQALLVDWLGEQAWSNGRVAMMGVSHDGTTPWMAATQNPEALRTIVVAGMVSDEYLFYHTPQGAMFTLGPYLQPRFQSEKTAPQGSLEWWTGTPPERLCPEAIEAMSSVMTGTAMQDRHPEYWEARRFIDGFPDVTTSVLLTHGFEDRWGSGHAQQELSVWQALPETTPKHQLQGQWGHEFPYKNSFNETWVLDDWYDRLFTWLDFWLKGMGEPPDKLGTVAYQDGTGDWHNSTAWPPAEARGEVLYLAHESITASPGTGERAFRSIPDWSRSDEFLEAALSASSGWHGPLCTRDDGATALSPPHGLLYVTEPVDERVLIAGNPFAYLTLTSDLPGGLVTVTLLDLDPDFRCEGDTPSGARAITTGTADLRFHQGTYKASAFPTDAPTSLRIDLTNLAEAIEPGHQLAAFVSYGDPWLRTGEPYAPTIDVHGESHLILPLVEGTFGGEAPTLDYPPRPFTPPESSSEVVP